MTAIALRQTFKAALQQLKTELIHDLNNTNTLDRGKMIAFQSEYNQKLVNVQVQFLKMLANSNQEVDVKFTKPDAGSTFDYGKIALAVAASGGAMYSAMTFVTFATVQTSWIFWSTTTVTTLATVIAGIIGISATLVTSILTGGFALLVFGIVFWSFYPKWKQQIRNQLVKDFDNKILPKLHEWAEEVIKATEL